MKRYILTLVLAGLAVASCVREPGGVSADRQRLMHFRASAPVGIELAGTRAADDPEWAVNSIAVLVFRQTGGVGDFTYLYSAVGKNVEQEQNTEVYFDALLEMDEDPVRLLCVANCPDGALNNIAVGDTEAGVRTALTSTGFDFSQGLPMTGVAQLASLSTDTGIIRFPLMRSIAKATVEVDLRESSADFTLVSATVYRTNDGWQIFPDAASVQDEATAPMPVSPSIPVGATAMNRTQDAVDASQLYTCYPGENTADDDSATSVCIVVGGIFEGDSAPSYYRIDFGSDVDPEEPPGQILRNYWYRFTIVGANTSGWTTPEDAADNPPSGLDLTVVPWNGGGNTDYYFGDGDYIKLSRDTMLLDAVIDHTDKITITTSDVPFTITSTGFPGAGTLSTSPGDSTLTTDIMSFSMTSPGVTPDGVRTWELEVTALTDKDPTVDYLELHADNGRITILIEVQRYVPPVVNDPTKRKIRIYSLGSSTIGSMDYLSTGNGLSAVIMNTDYFGPEGTVVCGGFEFLGVGAPAAADLPGILADVDVITTTWLYNPTTDICQIIYDWMQQPGHVIFLTGDDASTTTNLRSLIEPTLVWYDNDSVTGTGVEYYGSGYTGIKPAVASTDNTPFMDGIFGSVYDCASLTATPYDGITQFISTINASTRAEFVPLMVATGSDGDDNDIALMGVDPVRRTVYIGEGQLFHDDYWNTTTPYDPTDYINVLMSNTMAWAVNTVINENYDVPGMTDVE